ncbi:AAA family ATPase [Microbacterium sp. NPDC057650]|uniref:AAA family ATPase n=1 Tax=unclassified Microbacterium TaxID=2609290 RepID=UPI00366C5819
MPRLVLINGAPGSGKSTIAQRMAEERPLALALDIDQLKHALGRWEQDPIASGLQARRLALAVVDEQIGSGHDVFIGQYLARTEFIEALQTAAERRSAEFDEFVLDVDEDVLAERLRGRAATPGRPEHTVNARLVDPSDASTLVASLSPLKLARPDARWITGNGTPEQTTASIEAELS